jgi:MoaA/NifB/PqqE/SkfB family radical SAM enzyme
MVDAKPYGEHMSDKVFEQSLKFIRDINPMVILVSGGEPTEHTQFIEYMNRLIEVMSYKNTGSVYDEVLNLCGSKNRIIITSNGMFAENEKLTQQIIDLGVTVQITHDDRYYKLPIKHVKHDNFVYVDMIGELYPGGRARNCGVVTSPKCFNIRNLISNEKYSLKNAIKTMESHFKFCNPMISPDGNIRIGECIDCEPVGNVFNSLDCITKNISEYFSCNNCCMYDHLNSELRKIAYRFGEC